MPVYPDRPTASSNADPFAAQLVEYRDQMWWTDQKSETRFDSATPDATQHPGETPKRAVSIREIRERMNSDQKTIATGDEGKFGFEPGLKFLDTVRGGWKDMEMFVE